MRQGNNILDKVACEKSKAKSDALHINLAITFVCAYALWGGLRGLSQGFNGAWEYGLLGVVGLYGALYRWIRFIDLYTDWDM